MRCSVVFLSALLIAPTLWADDDREDVQKRLRSAAEVFEEVMAVPEKAVPHELLERAQCVAVVPSMLKGGFIVGAKHGKGAVTCKRAGRWGAPVMIAITGGNIGLQIGGEAVDLVMLIMNEKGKRFLYNDKFTIGAGVSAAAGPVGRSASAETNATIRAEILTYSRSRGLFAGATIDGASVRPDKDANQALYGRVVSVEQVLNGNVQTPSDANVLISAVSRHARMAVRERPRTERKPGDTADRPQ